MSTRRCVARALCVVLTTAVATGLRPAHAGEACRLAPRRAEAGLPPGSPLQESSPHLASDRGGRRRLRPIRSAAVAYASPAVGRARTSPHALHVEMVSPSKMAGGTVGVFRVERYDPAGLSHVTAIRLSPEANSLREGEFGSQRGPRLQPFRGTDGSREIRRGAGPRVGARDRLPGEPRAPRPAPGRPARHRRIPVQHRARSRAPASGGRAAAPEPLAVLAAAEADAESVEAVVLQETGRRPAIANGDGAGSKAKVEIVASTAQVPEPLYFHPPANRSSENFQ